MKTSQQIQFQQSIKSLDMQFQIFENPNCNSKLTGNRLNELQQMLKNLKKVYDRMQQRMRTNLRNKNYDEYQIKNKIKKYNENMQKMKDRFKKLQDKAVEIQKNQLIKNRSLNQSEITDFQKIGNHVDRVNNINRQAQETLGIYREVVNQTDRQNRVLDDIRQDANQFQHQLGLSDQIMRVIANRQLVTKLMLVLLVFFLGLADFLILLVKLL